MNNKSKNGQKPIVGVIGTGVMGLAIAQCLLGKGYPVVTYDIDAQRNQLSESAGATIAANPASVVQQAQIVFVVVLDAGQISQVFEPTGDANAGLLRGLALSPSVQSGQCPTVLLCSTISPEDAQRFAAQVQEAGAWVLDAPISGGPHRAAQGTMSVMLAGGPVAKLQALGVLADCSANQFTVSDQPGDAMRAKLVNNLMAASNLVAAAQAMTLASAMGLDLVTVAKIAAASSGQSWMCDDRITRALHDDYEPRAQLHVLTKDVTLACAAARHLQVPLPLGDQAAQVMQQACQAGHRAQDDAIVFQYCAQVASQSSPAPS
jgi:L-threonate 2-dehydrogenase